MKKYHTLFKPYLDDLSARKPSPGGGSAVCLFVCLGVSLIEKAIQYSLSSKNTEHRESLRRALRILAVVRKKVLPLVDRDSYLFAKIMTTRGNVRLGWLTKSERLIVDVGTCSRAVFLLAKEVESGIKKDIMSDFSIGLSALRLALTGCAQNLKSNEALFGRKNKYTGIFDPKNLH